jgi:hypothetical protein
MAMLRIHRSHAAAVLFLLCIVVLRRPFSSSSSLPAEQTKTTTAKQPPRFVFLIGLEGTGHHLYSDLVAKSPTMEKMRMSRYDMIQLQQSLYNNKNRGNSLWGVHCDETLVNNHNNNSITPTATATAIIMDRVVANIHVLDQNLDSSLTIPINGPKYTKSGFGMMSYPTFSSLDKEGSNHQQNKRCALTKYPNMDLLYHACDMANVTCGHIYLHRDPTQVLRSTTIHRHFHTWMEALHLYTTMLHVIHAQLLTYPNQLVSCWDYNVPPTFSNVGQLLGWKSEADFDQVVQEVYNRTPSSTNGEATTTSTMDDFHHDPYFHSMQRAHERNKKLCAKI